jgi:hypothetical protein
MAKTRLKLFALVLIFLSLFLSVLETAPVAQAAETRSTSLWTQSGARDFAGWKLDGLKVEDNSLKLGQALSGSDPYGKNGYRGGNYYNGGSYFYGEALSPYYGPTGGFDSLIPSWNARTPSGTWISVSVRVLVNGRWTKFYNMGVWASDTGTVKRHSVNGQDDANAKVETDTLVPTSRAAAFQVKTTLFSENPSNATPVLQRVSVNTLRNGTTPTLSANRAAWGRDLPVPERSQMIYPGGGEVWCSPTSLSMVMAFLGEKYNLPGLSLEVPNVASSTYDWIYDGNGNWPFNVAYASSINNLNGFVTRFHGLAQVEAWIEAGLPVIASVSYSAGQLPGSPISATGGHLLVIRGFDTNGNVITNDPAGDPRQGEKVRIVYPRAAFEKVWLNGSGGTVYLLFPAGFNGVKTDPNGAWRVDSTEPAFGYSEFEQLWASNDAATRQGTSGRGWIWGPYPFSAALLENYNEAPDGWRTVQYFDKSRMEVTAPQGDRNSKWFVTNGLLTQELVSGRIQTGNSQFVERSPARIPVAGDPDSPLAPTYATFNGLASLPGFESSRRAPNLTGQFVNATLDRDGNTGQTGDNGGVRYGYYSDKLGHNIPDVLWSWMNNPSRSGMDDWLFVLGYPTSEPFWIQVNISGKPARVLVQLFERRALTYNPANTLQWRVEMGNIGQHYYRWRYQ